MRDMVLHLHFEPRMAPRAILYGALTAALSFIGTVSADECRLDTPLSGPQAAPTSAPGTQWTYSGGAGLPATPMLLKAVQNGQRELEIAEGTLRREWIDTYADVNPLRKGDKVLLRFPLKVDDQWQDRFEEPGEFNARSGRYRYDYEEQGQSRVTAIETVRTAVGEVSAYRIEREARWRKSNARAVPGRTGPMQVMAWSRAWSEASAGTHPTLGGSYCGVVSAAIRRLPRTSLQRTTPTI